MARVLQDVTDAELAVLQELWSQGSATIRQLMDVLYPEGGPSPFATVQKLLERLTLKGYVTRERTTGVHVYRALLDREELAGRWLEALADRLGEESLTPLLTHLVASRLSTRELEELRTLLNHMLGKAQRKNPGAVEKEEVVDSLLQLGLSNAVMAALLAVLAFGVGKLFRRPALVHALWLLVLLKLVTPSPFVVPVSWPAVTLPQSAVQGLEAETTVSLIGTTTAWLGRVGGPYLLTVWLAGAAFWFMLTGVRSVRFARLLHRYGRQAPAELQVQVQQLAREMGLKRCPDIRLLPGMLSPMLWGLGRRPWLLLPAELVGRLDREQLRTLVAHELAHARRLDHPWVRIVELLVLGLYWWYPVVWWARRRLREAEEQCCDAWVVWTLPESAPSYASALVETMAFLSAARPALPPAASGVGYVRVLERRLHLILFGAPPKGVSASGLLAVLGAGLLLLPLRPVWSSSEPSAPQVAATEAEAPARMLAVLNETPLAAPLPLGEPIKIVPLVPLAQPQRLATRSAPPPPRPNPPPRPSPPRQETRPVSFNQRDNQCAHGPPPGNRPGGDKGNGPKPGGPGGHDRPGGR